MGAKIGGPLPVEEEPQLRSTEISSTFGAKFTDRGESIICGTADNQLLIWSYSQTKLLARLIRHEPNGEYKK
jgi:hypothetical protein